MWNKSRGKFIQKNICVNDKDLPTVEYVIITPPVQVLEKTFSVIYSSAFPPISQETVQQS